MWIHAKKDKMKIYKQSQTYYLSRKLKNDIVSKITSSSYLYRTIKWNEVLKKSEADISEHFSNLEPLTETETVDLIQDNNLTDCQILKIFSYLSKKWGRKVVTKRIAKKLIARKSLLNNFLTKQILDTNSTLYFKSQDCKVLSRTVIYCYNIPGEICRKFKYVLRCTDYIYFNNN